LNYVLWSFIRILLNNMLLISRDTWHTVNAIRQSLFTTLHVSVDLLQIPVIKTDRWTASRVLCYRLLTWSWAIFIAILISIKGRGGGEGGEDMAYILEWYICSVRTYLRENYWLLQFRHEPIDGELFCI